MYCIARPLTREDEVIISTSVRASIEPQSLLKATTSDFVPSCFATDSGSVEGKLGRCVVAVDGGSWREPELGDLVRMRAS